MSQQPVAASATLPSALHRDIPRRCTRLPSPARTCAARSGQVAATGTTLSLADLAERLGMGNRGAFDDAIRVDVQPRRLRAGEVLYRPSDPLLHAFVIQDGVVATTSGDGKRVAFGTRGESLGLGWRCRVHPDEAVALTAVEALAIPVGPLLRARGAATLVGAVTMGCMSVALLRERRVAGQLLDLLPYSRLIAGLHYLAGLVGADPPNGCVDHPMPIVLSQPLLRTWLQLEPAPLSAGLRQLERYRVIGICFEEVQWLDARLLRELAQRMGPLGRLGDASPPRSVAKAPRRPA